MRLHGFTPMTEDFIAEWFDRLHGHPHRKDAPVEQAAHLFFVLRRLPDEDFPGGKWATIQHLEALIAEAEAELLIPSEPESPPKEVSS